MKRNATDSGEILDRAVREIRGMSVGKEEEEAILGRVKSGLQMETGKIVHHPAAASASSVGVVYDRPKKPYLTGCEDFQSLIPEYVAASLPASRTLLFQDHLMECGACWKAFEEATGRRSPANPETVSNARPSRAVIDRAYSRSFARSWKAAAAIAACVLMVTLLTGTRAIRNFIWPIDVIAELRAVDGQVYSIQWRDFQRVKPGQRLRAEGVRTGLASRAVLELADGSQIEMNERTELNIYRWYDGVVVNLRRGGVLVAAAKQHGGHLYVRTPDSRVSVVGTVFAVTASDKGSRVTVFEGQVQVQRGDNKPFQAVSAGQQVTTSPAMPATALAEDYRWSRELAKHLAMLQKFASSSETAAQALDSAGLRYRSNLVPVVPEDTVLLASFPNVEGSISQSYNMLEARISENTMLDRWWARHRSFVQSMMAVASRASRYAGPEIIIAAPVSGPPVVLTNAASPDALADALRHDPAVAGGLVHAAVNGDLAVLSLADSQIRQTLAYQTQAGTNRFQSSPLYQRLAQAYTEGVGWLLAADLQTIAAQNPDNPAELQAIGLQGMKELVVEQKTGRQGPAFFQTLGFNQARTGVLSWLGDPSAMGALNFVSASAYTAAGAVTKDPNLIVDDIFKMVSTLDEGRGLAKIEQFQQQNGVDLRRDVAASLGNEFLVAIDGPVLPSPSWKIILEVTDPGRLQNALTWSFNELNRNAAIEHRPSWSVTPENIGGWTSYKAVEDGVSGEIHYAFIGGYLLIAPRREVIADASRYWAIGSSLAQSTQFLQQLPADGRANFSAFVYHNIKSLTDSVPGGLLSGVTVKFPTLVCLYGYPDRIVMSSKGVLGTDIISAEGLGVFSAAVRR